MDIFRPPATSNQKGSVWERIENDVNLRQAGLDLEIEGSGDVTAYGQPAHRDHSVSGSGKIKFR